jgi:hypothetical protein
MSDTENVFWLGLLGISVFVLAISMIGPVSRAYTKWKTDRAFRRRRKAHRKP